MEEPIDNESSPAISTPDDQINFTENEETAPVRKIFIDTEKFKESGVITSEEFAQVIQQHVDNENVNWAEIEDIYGLYSLADNASKDTGGIPDSILKDGMNFVLSLQVKTLPDEWQRKHIMFLQRIWKGEMGKEKVTKRNTMVPMEAKEIHPFHSLQRKRKHPPVTSVVKSLMGVSALLSHARTCIKLDDGEHDVVETDGNIEIDGEPLTFDSWSKLSGSNGEIVSCDKQDQFENKVMPTPTILTVEAAPVKAKRFKKDKAEEEESSNGAAAETKKRTRTFSEEGEISSDSENSSSSSEDDSDAETNKKESRRSANRKQRRQNVENHHYDMKRRMQDIYNQRFDVICYLSTEQKVEFLQSLRMVYGEHDELMKSKIQLSKFLSQP